MIKKIINILLVISISSLFFACGNKEVKVGSKTFDASKVYTIAISQSGDKSSYDSIRKGFVIGMKDLGFLEDVNVKYLFENAQNNLNFAEQIADSYGSNSQIDVIITIGQPATVAMSNTIKDKPIVFIGVANAERLGLCDNNNLPKIDNITGVIDSHLFEERLNFINTNFPEITKLGIIYNSDDKMAQYDVDYFKFNATQYNIDIYTVSIKKSTDIDKALDNILPKVDGVLLVNDTLVDGTIPEIVKKAAANNKPVFGDSDDHRLAGVEIGTSRDFQLVGIKGAELVNKIIKEEKSPKDINIETVNFKIN